MGLSFSGAMLAAVVGLASSCRLAPAEKHGCASDLDCRAGRRCIALVCQGFVAMDAGATTDGAVDAAEDRAEIAPPTDATDGAIFDGAIFDGDGGPEIDAPPASPFTEFLLPTPNCQPFRIAVGTDLNLWFTESECNRIGRITTSGVITEFPLPVPDSDPFDIVLGPDGNMWFTQLAAGLVGHIDRNGVITEIAAPPPTLIPAGITVGPDLNLWITDLAGTIARLTVDGALTRFPLPTPSAYPLAITSGPDGNMWFTEEASGMIGRVTTAGYIIEISTAVGAGPSAVRTIASGPDDALWFTAADIGAIGRISVGGGTNLYLLDDRGSMPEAIARAPNGDLWFTEYVGDRLAHMTTAGVITEIPGPRNAAATGALLSGIAMGPDGAVWFTQFGEGDARHDAIVRYLP